MIYIPKAAEGLVLLAASEKGRYAMNCLKVKEYADGYFRLDATDGRVLGIVRGMSCPTAADEFVARKLAPPEAFVTEALLPSAEVKKAFGALPKATHIEKTQGGRKLGIFLVKPAPVLVAGEEIIPVEAAEARFPDCDAVLPKTPAPVSFAVDADYMIDILKAAKAVAVTRSDDPKPTVLILYWGHGRGIGVCARGGDGLTFDGLIMPLT